MLNSGLSVTVSFTSFPPRIPFVAQVVNSIVNQTVKPDRIVLWLAQDQFPDKEDNLPPELLAFKEQGLEINWCDDLRPHKKYFYTMQQYPDDIVITIDDDVVYEKDTLETLIKSFERYPFAVSALRAHQITFDKDGNLMPYEHWLRGVKAAHTPSHALLAVGVGGVLYPPRCFGSEVFNKEFIKKNCINADDLWLKISEVMYNVPVVLAAASEDVKNIKGSQTVALYKSNDLADKNDIQFKNILNHYDNFGDSRYSILTRLKISAVALENSDDIGGEASNVQLKLLKEETAKLKNSASYKIGRAVTFIPRSIDAAVRCINDNGFGYTVKLLLKRLK